MKKTKLLSLLLTGVLAIGLIGCGSKETAEDKTITIGVSPVPHEEIVEAIKPLVEAEGYKLEIKEFSDYVTPNTALYEEEIDANYFQHIAYLNETNSSNNYDLVNVAEIHIEPMALYSYKADKLEDLKDGAEISIPNDASNEARALRLLESAGLIALPEDKELVTPEDITENKKNLKITALEAAQLPRTLDEVDGAIINGNYALQAKLDANENGILVEDINAEDKVKNRNILAVKEKNKDSEKTKVLIKALTSDEARKFIEETYKGAVVPVF